MARPTTEWTNRKILERRKAGYGQGQLENYKPWLNVRDFSSIGTTYRLFSPKLGRPVVLFSNIERNAFLLIESLKRFRDFWEQYPLDRRVTLSIAQTLNIEHPRYSTTKRPAVLTLDGLFTPQDGVPEVIDCKSEKALQEKHIIRQLAMRQEYARHMGYPYRLFTEASVPRTVVHNLQWIRLAVQREGESTVATLDQFRLTKGFVESLAETHCARPAALLGEFLADTDRSLNAPEGFGNWALRKLMWAHRVEFDLQVPFRTLLRGPVSALTLRSLLTEGSATPSALFSAAADTRRAA